MTFTVWRYEVVYFSALLDKKNGCDSIITPGKLPEDNGKIYHQIPLRSWLKCICAYTGLFNEAKLTADKTAGFLGYDKFSILEEIFK